MGALGGGGKSGMNPDPLLAFEAVAVVDPSRRSAALLEVVLLFAARPGIEMEKVWPSFNE